MRRKTENIHQSTSTSETLEASLEYKYLKTLNNELSKEVAELRKDQARKQLDIDHLLSAKFNIELKYNHLYQLFSKIEERSRFTLNHMVECSNELAYIMQITNGVKSLSSKLSDSPIGTIDKTKESSFKQIVTPHAVNGHIIHTPTIRIKRYNEPTSETRPKSSVNNAKDLNFEDDNSSSEEEVIENDEEVINEEDRGNRSFNSRCTISSLINSDLDSLEEDPEEMIDASPPKQTDQVLSTIQEELEELTDQDEIDQPVFSRICQEVKSYSNRLSEKMSRVNNKRGSNNSTSDSSELDNSNSSVIPEASTSYNVSSKLNDDDAPYENNFLKRKSLIERKSIGSPIPSKILRRSTKNQRRSSERKSLSLMGSSSTPLNSQEFRPSITSAHSDISEALQTTLRNSSIKSSEESVDTTINNSDTSNAAASTSIFVPTIKSFIEKTSIHSTPSIDSSFDDVTTTLISKVNFRKARLNKSTAIPVVNITRLSQDDMEHVGKLLKKSMNNRKRSREEKSFGDEKAIKKENSFDNKKPIKSEKSDTKKKNKESNTTSPSFPKKLSFSNEDGHPRPRRKRKSISFKEPNLNRKLRRS